MLPVSTEAMIETIWRRSYRAASIDAICERAGVRKDSFHHFFKSKTALAAAAIVYRVWKNMKSPRSATC